MKCRICDFDNPDGIKRCGCCGGDLSNNSAASIDLSWQLDESAIDKDSRSEESRLGAIGERKYVTVMFSDLTGYTEISEKLDPEEIKELTGTIFSELTKIIEKYDGFIEKYIGDAILAVFGAVEAFEDSAIRAIKAAQEIHSHVQSVSPKYEDLIGRPLSMHTGINTGLVVTGTINFEMGTHGMVGDTINTAARLMSVSQPGDITVDYDSFIRAEGYFYFEAQPPCTVKNKAMPLFSYKLLSSKEIPDKVHRISGRRAHLVGRKVEMGILAEALAQLRKGHGSIVTISGEAGTGKSRLVSEFKTTMDRETIQWREGHAYGYTQNIPYYPLINLLTHAFQIEENDAPETIRSKIDSGVAYLLDEGGPIIPYVGSLFALNYSEIESISPGYWKGKVQESIQMLLTALVGKGPTVVCFEDLHWADPSFIELLHKLIIGVSDSALFICTFRTHFSLFEGPTPDFIKQRSNEIHLKELSPSDAQEMVVSLLRTESLSNDLVELVRQKAEGNPFYLEEMINALIDEGILAQDKGIWKLNRNITEADIPATIQGVLTARVDKLDNFSKRVLQEASVIGRAFLYDILKRITETDKTIDQYLSGLEGLDLIRIRTLAPELEYIFKHALTQEVVYSGLLKKERRKIHERIGLAIERLFSDRISEFCEILAYHFQRGHSINKATLYLFKSGEKSLSKFALEEAHKYFQLSMDLLPVEGADHKNQLYSYDILNKWAFVYYYRGDMEGMYKLLGEYHDQVLEFHDKTSVAMFLAWYGWANWGCEKYKEAETILKQALQIAEANDEQKIISYIHSWLAWHYVTIGRYDESLASGHKAIQIAQTYKTDHYIQFKPLSAIAFVYYSKGDRKNLLATVNGMLNLGDKKGNFPAKIFGTVLIAASHLLDGNFPKAVEWSEKVNSEGKEIIHENCALLVKGIAYLLSGDKDRAVDPLESMVGYCSGKWQYLAISGELMMAVVEVASGRINVGMRKIENIRNEFHKNDRGYDWALSEYLIGSIYCQIALGEGDVGFSTIINNLGFLVKNLPVAFKKAEKHLKEAIVLSDRFEAMGVKGQALLELGRLYVGKKKVKEAKACLMEAIETFELCGIDTFKQKAQDILAVLN